MIRIVAPTPPLRADETFGLDTLIDISRVLRVDDGDGVVVRVAETSGKSSIDAWRQADWGIELHDAQVFISRAALSFVTALSGAVREQRSRTLDRHGRVPSGENELVRQHSERDPVISWMAARLRMAVAAAANGHPVALLAPWPNGKRWAMAISHDLDVVNAWPAFTALRIAELLGKGRVGRALRSSGLALRSIIGNPVWEGVNHVLRTEDAHGVRSTWFIIAGTPTLTTFRRGDVTYAPESRKVRRVLKALHAGGHELGLHGSFASYVDAQIFSDQRRRLEAIAPEALLGVRQHFLRMRPGISHRAMAAAGFQYDSTCGFPDRNGYRLGVADVVPIWSDAEQQSLPIDAVPFVWMDRALSKYAGVEEPDVWIDEALALAGVCRDTSGLWCGVWHPNLTGALGFPDAPRAFVRLLEGLMHRDPWPATMHEIVDWRRARRAARGTGATTGGAIQLRVPAGAPNVSLEDESGVPIRSVHV